MKRNRHKFLSFLFLFCFINTIIGTNVVIVNKSNEVPNIEINYTETEYTGNLVRINMHINDDVEYLLFYKNIDETDWNDKEPINAGSYDVKVVTVENDNYQSVSKIFLNALTITKKEASITVNETELVYDGTVKSPTIITNPIDLKYSIKYFKNYTEVFNPISLGEYSYEITIEDDNYFGRYYSEFIIVDKTPPLITLIGDEIVELEYAQSYVEQGAIAIDDIGGNVDIFVDNKIMKTDSLYAEYLVEYSALDSYDNFGYAYRTVKIVPGDYDNDSFGDDVEDLNGNLYLKDEDTDLDGIPNYADEDDDGDGILSIVEGNGDEDCDGIVNYLDPTDDSGIHEKWGDVIIIDNSKDSLKTFQWFKNDVLIPNAKESFYYDPEGINGTYYVTGVDIEGNVYESCHKTILKTSKKAANVSIYPNPGNETEVIFISFTGTNDSPKNVDIYDLLGNKIISFSSELNTIEIPKGIISKGIYLINASSDNFRQTKKLIIQ